MSTRSYAQLEGSEGEYQRTCPISELIEISAPFAGIDPQDLRDNDDFCRFKEPEYSLRKQEFIFPRRERNINQCQIIWNIIDQRIKLVEEVLSFDPLLSMDEIYNLPISKKEKLGMFEELNQKSEKVEETNTILKEWRESIYELLGDGDESNFGDNPHFSGFKWEELTDEVVLDEVKKFNRALDRERLGMNQEESCPGDFSGVNRILRSLSQK